MSISWLSQGLLNHLSMMGTSPAPPPPQFARLKDDSPLNGDGNFEDEAVEDVEDVRSNDLDCSLSDWGEWSDCSSECDRGTRFDKKIETSFFSLFISSAMHLYFELHFTFQLHLLITSISKKKRFKSLESYFGAIKKYIVMLNCIWERWYKHLWLYLIWLLVKC